MYIYLSHGSINDRARGGSESASGLKIHTTRWMAVNYIDLLVWIFIWMFDQARMQGKTVLVWPAPFSLAGRLRLTRRKV